MIRARGAQQILTVDATGIATSVTNLRQSSKPLAPLEGLSMFFPWICIICIYRLSCFMLLVEGSRVHSFAKDFTAEVKQKDATSELKEASPCATVVRTSAPHVQSNWIAL